MIAFVNFVLICFLRSSRGRRVQNQPEKSDILPGKNPRNANRNNVRVDDMPTRAYPSHDPLSTLAACFFALNPLDGSCCLCNSRRPDDRRLLDSQMRQQDSIVAFKISGLLQKWKPKIRLFQRANQQQTIQQIARSRDCCDDISSIAIQNSDNMSSIRQNIGAIDAIGYEAPPELVTWEPFMYATPHMRSQAVHDRVQLRPILQSRPLKVMVIGGPSSGKGTLAAMIAQALGSQPIGVGDILRGDISIGGQVGLVASKSMAIGTLLPDDFVSSLLRSKVNATMPNRNGWLLDGFPRTITQAESALSDIALKPDCVVVLERPTELIKEFALGRYTDPKTGVTYHPRYAPPPEGIRERLVRRIDDTIETLERRISAHESSIDKIVDSFVHAGVPIQRFTNARSELATFEEIADFLENVSISKDRQFEEIADLLEEAVRLLRPVRQISLI